MISLGGLVNQKAFGKFEMGKVISNPFANAFVNEAEGEDHEVSMGQNQLDTIIKMATELKAKMGENEKEIPAWIQDHISKAENYISQAAGNYHEYGTNESTINEVDMEELQSELNRIKKENPGKKVTYSFIKGKQYPKDYVIRINGKISEDIINESFVNEVSYDLGNKQYTKRNMTPVQILDLAMAYAKVPGKGNPMYGNKMPKMIAVANDLAKLNGTIQLDAKIRTKEPALILSLLKNKLVSKEEYVELYKNLLQKQISVIGALKNADPASRMVGGAAARQAHKDMKGQYDETIGEAKKYDIGAGYMGNGLTIWNRAEKQYGDYKIIAHIDPYGKISIRDKAIPSNVMKMIEDWSSAMKKGNK